MLLPPDKCITYGGMGTLQGVGTPSAAVGRERLAKGPEKGPICRETPAGWDLLQGRTLEV